MAASPPSPERRRELGSAGGRAAHAAGSAHRFTPEEAARVGALGGKATSKDREHMARIGRKGGQRRKAERMAEEV